MRDGTHRFLERLAGRYAATADLLTCGMIDRAFRHETSPHPRTTNRRHRRCCRTAHSQTRVRRLRKRPELCGHEFSSSTISRIVQKLDEELERFAKRRLEEPYPYLILDARYEKVREDGAVRSQAVLIAIGAGRPRSATRPRGMVVEVG